MKKMDMTCGVGASFKVAYQICPGLGLIGIGEHMVPILGIIKSWFDSDGLYKFKFLLAHLLLISCLKTNGWKSIFWEKKGRWDGAPRPSRGRLDEQQQGVVSPTRPSWERPGSIAAPGHVGSLRTSTLSSPAASSGGFMLFTHSRDKSKYRRCI